MRKEIVKLSCVFLCLSLFACKKKENASPKTDEAKDTSTIELIPKLVHNKGALLFDENENPFLLRGVAFGNEVWTDKEIPNTHHTEADFVRVKEMGMNAIRFYMNYKTFENDASPYSYKKSGFDWIDQNIAWAKANGVYLILNMHVPQGGFQSQGDGQALWSDAELQNRLASLWKAIAEKYKNEASIAAFDLVNEPIVSSSITQWENLSQKIIDSIRTVDKHHLIIVERLLAKKDDWAYVGGENMYFKLKDDKIMYQFHFYEPIQFTHQNASWTDFGDGGSYPDENLVSFTSEPEWKSASFNNSSIKENTTGWEYYEGTKFKISNTSWNWAAPTMQIQNIGDGKIYFDSIVVKEFDQNGLFIKNVFAEDLEDLSGYYFWKENGVGSYSLSTSEHYGGKASFYVTGTTSDANLSNNKNGFAPTQGFSYQVCAWVKSENIPTNSTVKLRVDVYNAGVIQKRNKALLENLIGNLTSFGKKYNVPLYCGEFGAIEYTFENNKGGINWVNDVMDILIKEKVNFTYHAYHEDSFGIYKGYGSLPNPANANQDLIHLFKTKLTTN